MRAMFRQFSSIAMSKAPTSMTVLNVISKHIQDLSKKREYIFQLRKDICEHEIEVLDMMQREVLRSQPRVVHQLLFLKKLHFVIMRAGKLHTSVPITMTHTNFPLSIISKHVEDLHQKLAVISQIEESISPGVHIDGKGHDLLDTKTSVVYQINVLRMVFEDIAWETELSLDQLENPVMMKSRGMADIIPPDHSFEPTPMRPKESVRHYKAVPYLEGVGASMKTDETVESKPLDKHRYLLVSNGFEIYCLDLMYSKYLPLSVIGDIPSLPIIATLNLPEGGLPTAVGLFKWRSNAYMIGGLLLPKALKEDRGNYYCIENGGENPKGIKLYRALCWSNKVKPTSPHIHGLSLDDSKTTLSHSESNMGKLKKPKIWPIVEEINDEIHVIDCLPSNLVSSSSPDWISSHEVLDCDSGCWGLEEVPIPSHEVLDCGCRVEKKIHIKSCLVVGYKIYAVSMEGFLVFNSRKNKWKAHLRTQWEGDVRLPFLRDVWDILEKIRVVRCVGGFPYGNVRDPLYVVIALEDNFDNDFNGTHALAFLLTSSGQIICFQRLTHIFRRPVLFRSMVEGTIIEVEEDKLGKNKTMCSIIGGSPWEDSNDPSYVLIDIFTVEELPDAADKVREFAAKGSEAWPPVELEFARVHVMERRVYKIDAELYGEGDLREWFKVQACFL